MPPDPRRPFPVRTILGLDEAGRGAAVGPLVVAGVVLDSRKAGALTRRGVRDSKRLGSGKAGRKRRRALAGHIRRLAERVAIRVYEAAEVDRYTEAGLLNALERRAAREMLAEVGPVDRVIADGERLFQALAARSPGFEAVNDGESRHVAVAAASVIAKDRRDALFSRISRGHATEDDWLCGGGYVNAATAAFLRRHHSRTGGLPKETRLSWNWSVIRELARPPDLFRGSADPEVPCSVPPHRKDGGPQGDPLPRRRKKAPVR